MEILLRNAKIEAEGERRLHIGYDVQGISGKYEDEKRHKGIIVKGVAQ